LFPSISFTQAKGRLSLGYLQASYAPLIALICVFYVFAALVETGRFDWRSAKTDQYNLLTQAFLAGSTHLLVAPRPELLALPDPQDPRVNEPYRMHDTALYKGRYYSVYGPTPVLTAFGPYRLLTGYDLPENGAACLYAILGFLFSAALFFSFQSYAFPNGDESPRWLNGLCLLSLGICQFVPTIVRRPKFYEIAILSGYCFAMAGFCFLLKAALVKNTGASFRSLPALLAGLCFALLVGCRPVFLPVPILALAFYAGCRFPLERWQFLQTRSFYFLFIPIVAGYLSMGWYNYARFGNPLETGHRYALTMIVHMVAQPRLVNLSPSLFLLLFCPFQIDSIFPFLHFASPSFTSLPAAYFQEYVVGAFVATPLLFGGVFFFFRLTGRVLRLFGALLLASAGSVALLIASVGWVTQRYALDFVPELLLVACWSMVSLWRTARSKGRQKRLAWVLSTVVAYSVIVHTAMGIGGCYDNLLHEHVQAYQSFGERLTDLVHGRLHQPVAKHVDQVSGGLVAAADTWNNLWTLGILDNPAEGKFSHRVVRIQDNEAARALKVGDTLIFRSSGARKVTATFVQEGFRVVQLDQLVNPAMDGWPRPIAIADQ
jgi:hypothetical protein